MEGRSISKASSVTEIGCGKNSRGRYKPYSSVALRSPKSHPQRVDGQLILRRARQRCRRCSTKCLDDRRRTADRSGKRERVFLKVSVWDGQKLAFFRIKFVQLIIQSSTKKIESQYGSSTYEQPSIRSCSISWGIEKKKKGRWRFQTVAPTDQRWTLKAAEPAMTTMFQSWDEKSERIKRPGRSSLGGHREICESLAIICELPDRKISQILAKYPKYSQIIANYRMHLMRRALSSALTRYWRSECQPEIGNAQLVYIDSFIAYSGQLFRLFFLLQWSSNAFLDSPS